MGQSYQVECSHSVLWRMEAARLELAAEDPGDAAPPSAAAVEEADAVARCAHWAHVSVLMREVRLVGDVEERRLATEL